MNSEYQTPIQTLIHWEVVDSSKYLGVTISEDLARKEHIDNTVNKANKTLGFIRRNLGDCTAPVKAAAYSTVVGPVIEYLHSLESSSIKRHSCRDVYSYSCLHPLSNDRKALRTRLIISPMLLFAKTFRTVTWRCDDVMTFESTQPTPLCLEKSSVRKCTI